MYNKSLDPCLAAWPALAFPGMAWQAGRAAPERMASPITSSCYLLPPSPWHPAAGNGNDDADVSGQHVKMSPSFELNLKHFVVVVVVGPPLNWVLFLSSKRCHTWHTYVSKYSNVHKYIYNTYVCMCSRHSPLTHSLNHMWNSTLNMFAFL